jgi:hypothetical protein
MEVVQGLSGPNESPPIRWTSPRILHGLVADCVVQATGVNNLLSDLLKAGALCCGPPMTDRARRIVGLVIGPLLIVVGLWLCAEAILHGNLGNVFWIGPFLAMAGGLWLASDWFEF